MFVSLHSDVAGPVTAMFKLRALKMGSYYLASENFGAYEFIVSLEWNPHSVCVAIVETLTTDNEKPIAITLGGVHIRIDPVIAGELFDCLFAITIIRDHQ